MKKSKPERKDGHKLFGTWMLRRKIDDAFHTIFKKLKEQDSDGFKGYARMDVDHFEELVYVLSPFLQKQDTNRRECISLE